MKTWAKSCKMCGSAFSGGQTARFCKQCKLEKRRDLVKRRASVKLSEKRCCACKTVKSPGDFNRSASGYGGLYDMCRECAAAYKASPRQRALNRVARRKRYEREDPAERKKKIEARRLKNRDEWLASLSRRHAERRESDPIYSIKCSIRTCIRNAFARLGYAKSSRTAAILGCSWQDLLDHLASLCYGGMTLDDILAPDGRVHIDHIVPLATAETVEDVERLNHYTNLQPLWAADNLEKADRLDWVHPRDR